ncbi:arogenate dehydratase/prephenate dehydratase 6, chloroplastic-like [Glycine soja]|uniref:Arogenate dehydratase n=1 Tax=Glycine soja TaxID=3848 RepID=A0A445I2L8_GLYSO|nr:arogenate dehydratase/prephenate dehydratase 6, chloroplastic-like [Glycine soja]RZB80338.1 Arogenate dehydratase/prephenate dehydratase 6, chloroplastic [Glycine soja]
MQTLNQPCPNPLNYLTRARHSAIRFAPTRFTVKCGYGFESASFSQGVGASRADWQSSCAILASKVVSQREDSPAHGGDNNNNVGAVNGHNAAVTNLNLVPVKADDENIKPIPPKPLTISDLLPAPMHGSQLRVAYQGVPGAYSEAAAGKAYPNGEAIPCDQFEVAFQAVELWIADRAVLPVENSFGGSIHRNYDLLLRHRLHIVGEVQLPVHHCLLALPGVRKESLERVISHPQALAQCEHSLTKLGLTVAREAVDDTAGAAEFVAKNDLRSTAAIASARAAELYGLQILADGIQDDPNNVTRFVMLAREPIIPRTDRPFKTSIVFAHDKGTSVLFKVLSAFAFRNISLTKIESRPHRSRPIRVVDDESEGTAKHFEYLFYIDFEASMAEVRAQNALAEVQEFTSFLRVLGSYPIDMSPWTPSCPRQN